MPYENIDFAKYVSPELIATLEVGLLAAYLSTPADKREAKSKQLSWNQGEIDRVLHRYKTDQYFKERVDRVVETVMTSETYRRLVDRD